MTFIHTTLTCHNKIIINDCEMIINNPKIVINNHKESQ